MGFNLETIICNKNNFAALGAAPVASLGWLWHHREERPELGDAGHWMQGTTVTGMLYAQTIHRFPLQHTGGDVYTL